jgi:hypothetical protein
MYLVSTKFILIFSRTMFNYCLEFYAEFPEDFSTEMTMKEFLLYINANGIRYKVCKKLKGIQRVI